ncbi:MAG: hypothetical protein K6V97_10080 [Actinomycetia bacterium]|nr:hypothetical protein [Actinomycetes bacterium]
MDWTVLDAPAQETLRRLARWAPLRRFRLAGGTGLALQLGHRRSQDLDWFTSRRSSAFDAVGLIASLEQADLRPVVQLQQADEVRVLLGTTPVTFVAYPFPWAYPPAVRHPFLLADCRDIALMKAYAVGRRATARDYLDLAVLLDSGRVTVPELVHRAERLFRLDGEAVFSPRLFLQQLVYTADLPDKADAVLLVRDAAWTWSRVEQVLQRHVREAVWALFGEGGMG